MPTAPKWLNDALEKIAPSFIRVVSIEETVYLNPHLKKIRVEGDFTTLDFSPGFTISLRVTPTELRHYTVSHADDAKKAIESSSICTVRQWERIIQTVFSLVTGKLSWLF